MQEGFKKFQRRKGVAGFFVAVCKAGGSQLVFHARRQTYSNARQRKSKYRDMATKATALRALVRYPALCMGVIHFVMYGGHHSNANQHRASHGTVAASGFLSARLVIALMAVVGSLLLVWNSIGRKFHVCFMPHDSIFNSGVVPLDCFRLTCMSAVAMHYIHGFEMPLTTPKRGRVMKLDPNMLASITYAA